MTKKLYNSRDRILAFTLSLTMFLGICLQPPTFKVQAIENETSKNGTSDNNDQYLIYPVPQSIEYDQNKSFFNLNNGVNLILEDGVDKATRDYVEEVLTSYKINYTIKNELSNDKTNLCLGINNSNKIVDSYVKSNISINNQELFNKSDAYLMDLNENAIVILGKDTDSTFYGVATLKMILSSFNNEKLLNAKIEDYATVANRGFIEGFYGGWNYEERESLMNFAKDYKMNSYVYASKTDEYHTSKWGELYPIEELNKIAELVKIGEKTKVRYGWSVHISGFFSGLNTSDTAKYEDRYQKLIAKFQQLYDVGVRKFDILNDDFGAGTHEDVVKLLNRLDNEFIKPKGCSRLVYCPQGYNKSWSGNGAELEILKGLNETIDIYWTGDDVNWPITQETVNFLTEKTNHKPVFWLNYPVNEHSKSGIYLGDISYYARNNVSGLAGFVSNPSRFAESNKVGLFQLAALNWNNNNYLEGAQKLWEDSFKYLQPEVKDSYLTIARNVANAPRSSRVPGFNESEYLKEKLDSVANKVKKGTLTANDTEVLELINEFDNMLLAIEDMKANSTNKVLLKELDPWLKSLKDVATSGKEILKSKIAVLNKDTNTAWESFKIATKSFETKYTYLTAQDLPNVYAEAGSKRLTPFISKVIKEVSNDIMPMFDIVDDSFIPSIYAVMGGAEKIDNADTSKIFDGNEETFASFVVNQAEGDYIGVDMGKTVQVNNLHILQAKDDNHHDYFHEAVLEYSIDGSNWTEIKTYNNQVRIDLENLNFKARYVRLRLIKDKTKPYWTYIREFTVNREAPKQPRVFTNVQELKETPITIAGKKNSISNLNNITLKKNEYLGIKLIDISTASNLVNEVSKQGLTVEYSINGTTWNELKDSTINLKYIRLINKSSSDITLNINEFGISITNLKVNPKMMETNIANGLQQGDYKNLFDGDLSTFAWTNKAQAVGDYITFDLGNTTNVHDVKVVTSDGNPRLYNAEIQISKDNKEWTTIGTVVNDNSVFEVPYRYVAANGEGKDARYLRIYITGNTGYYLKIHEIQINNSVKDQILSELSSSLKGDINKIIDKDISTVFTQIDAINKSDYIEYTISENTNIDSILLLQEPSNGVMKVKTKDGYVKVSDLNKSVIDIDTKNYEEILSIRLEWEAGETPSIYELAFKTGENKSGDIGLNVDNIIKEDAEEAITNIALRKPVIVSGTSDGNKDNVNDGDDNTKWDSNFIKGTGASEDAWITIDLGEKKNEITQVIVKYFNKIYPTKWQVQISTDNQNWKTIKTLQKEHNGPVHPIETINFDTPISARYVRLFFTELNSGAAGNGVGVKEFVIMGRNVKEVQVDYSNLGKLIKSIKEKDLNQYTNETVTNLNDAVKEAELLIENGEVTQEEVNSMFEKLQSIENALVARGNISTLSDLIESYKSLKKSDYTSESWNKYKTKLDIASAIVKDNSNSTQADVDNAKIELENAKNALVKNEIKKPVINMVSPESIKVLENVELKLNADNLAENKIYAMEFDIEYNKEKFEFVEAKSENNNKYIVTTVNKDNSLKVVVATKGVAIVNLEDIVKLTFKAKDVGENIVFNIINAKAATEEGTEIELENSSVSISIESVENTEKVDKTLLKYAIDYAKYEKEKEEFANLVPAIVKEFEKILKEAEEIFADENSTEVQVELASKKLINIIHMLNFKKGDKTELQKLVRIVNALEENNYTVLSWSNLQSELKKANEVIKDENAMEEEVAKAYKSLENAFNSLEKSVDKSKLEKLVNELQSKDLSKYTQGTVSKFNLELKNAKGILANNDSTKEQIDEAYNKLIKAYLDLRLVPDKSKLEELLNKAEEIDLSKYTRESVYKFNLHVANVKNVLNNENATQEEVTKAQEGLEMALANLEETPQSTKDNNINDKNNKDSDDNSNNKKDYINPEDNSKNNLPNTGAIISSTVVAVIAIVGVIAGVMMMRKKKEKQ